MKLLYGAALLACLMTTPARAAPGLGDEVYGATVDKGEWELESRWAQLHGRAASGEGVIKLEGAYTPTSRLRIATFGEFEREAGGPREWDSAGIEGIYHLARIGGVDVAAYGEFAIARHGQPETMEAKVLLERTAGPLDLRLNLTGEKALAHGEKVELSYAASADVAALGELRLGAEAFGDLGDFHRLAPHAEHFAGPAAKAEIEGLGPEIGIEAGYLFAIDRARDETRGQMRFSLEVEF